MTTEQLFQDEPNAVEIVIQRGVAKSALEFLQDVNACLGDQGRQVAVRYRIDEHITHQGRDCNVVVVPNSRGFAFRFGNRRYTVTGSKSGYQGNVKQVAACLWCNSSGQATLGSGGW
jgi:hypothetical protein